MNQRSLNVMPILIRNVFSEISPSAEFLTHCAEMLSRERLFQEFVIGSPKPMDADISFGPSWPFTLIYGVAYETPALTWTL